MTVESVEGIDVSTSKALASLSWSSWAAAALAAGVGKRRQLRKLKGLSRPPGAYAANTATGGAARVWMSVRFRRAEDEMVERERFSPFGTTAGGAES